MSRFLFLLCCISIFNLELFGAQAGYWQSGGEIKLKKDQPFRISLLLNNEQKDIVFHWTLYKNKGLVTVLKYDGFPYQFVLYTDYQRESFKLKLLRASARHEESPFMLLTFKEFDRRTKEATLEFKFRSPSEKLDVTY